MTFDRIEQALGFERVNEIAALVLQAASEAGLTADDADRHEALRELMTALLAVLVTRHADEDDRDALASDCSARLYELVEKMSSLAGTGSIPMQIVH